jgi:hypothetical protein
MVGLVPTIHDFFLAAAVRTTPKKSWMPATSAGMTVWGCRSQPCDLGSKREGDGSWGKARLGLTPP